MYGVVEQIETIIYGDLPDVNGRDDFKLWAGVGSIDGAGGAYAMGNTVYQRSASNLPYEGYIKLDEADVAKSYSDGNLDDVILHEIFHALGFGTAWDEMGLTKEIGGVTRFTGENAIEAYNTSYSGLAASDPYSHLGVPMSSDDAHWDHATFTKDVMTTSIYKDGNVLSDMDIAALEDMGYETIYADEIIFV